ncbi:hypothetical protein Tco_1108376 [Tanacetum coccineum]
MALSIADQIALDDALVAPADRLKIGKCNLRLSSDVTSKEATLQVVYDVLKLTPFYKAFQVTADAPEIYMQEFWASAYVHNRSVRFKMNNKKHIIGLEQFRDILQICPKVGNKKFVDPPLEKEILIFLASLGHSGDIRKITDVNVNKLHQPWRSFAAVINKCLSGTPSYDSLRLSQAQILWGMYNKKNVDYAYLLWEDFIFKIENKNTKKGSAMYYPRFTKLVVNYVMEKDPSIPRRNKVNWHYARDDPMFTTINVISRNEATQLYGAILPVALTNEDIRNSESYKEYYARASGTIPPKTKGSKKKANTDAIPKLKPPTAPKEKKSGKGKQKTTELENISEADLTEAEQLKIVTKRSRQAVKKLTALMPVVLVQMKELVDDDQDDEKAQDEDKNDVNETTQDDEDDDVHDDDENAQDDDDEEQTESEDDGDDFIHPKLTTHDDEIIHEEETDEDDTFDPIVHTPSHISSSDDEDSDNEIEGTNVEGAKSDEDATYEEDQGNEASRSIIWLWSPIAESNHATGVDDIFEQHAEATSLIDTPVTAIVEPSFSAPTNRPPTPNPLILRLERQFSKLRQINQYAEALSSIPGIVDHYLANKMQEAVDVAVQLSMRDSEEAILKINNSLDTIVEGTEGKYSRNKSRKKSLKLLQKLRKLELKKILIDKMEANKLYQQGTYGDNGDNKTTSRRADDDQEPSVGTDRGSKRRRSGKEPASTSAPRETDKPRQPGKIYTTASLDSQESASTISVPAVHESVQPWLSNLARRQDPQESFDKLTDTTFDFFAFVMNRLNVKTLIPELLAGPTFELMKGTCKSLTELEYFCEEVYKATIEKLDWINPEGRQYPHDLRQPLLMSLQRKPRLTYTTKACWEDPLLQLGVESYQKKLNLTKPDTYRSNLRRQDAYTPYSDPRGFIYENKDKKNRLMRIDELHKFSDAFWSQRDKEMPRSYDSGIDKRLKSREDNAEFGGDLLVERHTGVTIGYFKRPI